MIGANSADFTDPVDKVTQYKVAATTYKGGVYQLAAKLENDDNGNIYTSGAFLQGTYNQRLAKTGTLNPANDFSNTGTFNNNTASIYSGTINVMTNAQMQGYFTPMDNVTI